MCLCSRTKHGGGRYRIPDLSREIVRLAKHNIYRYLGCIIDQSKWSGPVSFVVMTPDLNRATWVCVPVGALDRSFFIYRSISPPTTSGARMPGHAEGLE